MTHRLTLLCFVLLLSMHSAHADDEDTRFLINTTQQHLQHQQSYWQQENKLESTHHITIDGQTYRIGDSTQEQAIGIYYALNAQMWDKAQDLLPRYRQQVDHKPELVLLVEGLVARSKHHYNGALYKLETARSLAPNDARIQLELARLYAEDHQNQASIQLFQQLMHHPELPLTTRPLINDYIQAIETRHGWHGSVSIGQGHADNINQANGSEICVMQFAEHCFITQSLPKPISSAFTNYQLSLSKKIPLGGHHNLVLRPIIYGSLYRKKDTESTYLNNYNENTSILYAGYNYKDAKFDLNLSPFVEHYYRDGYTNYTAPGLDLTAEYNLSPKWSINAQANTKRYRYASSAKKHYANYTQSSLGAGLSYHFSPSFILYSGLDWTRRKHAFNPSSSKEMGIRFGLFKYFESGFYLNALAVYKDNRFDDKTFLSPKPRHDKQQIYIAAIGAPKWNIKNIYPELRVKRVVNKSNLVFYKYRQNEISLNFKYNF